MRAAREWGLRPLVLLRGAHGKRWTFEDRVLVVASVLADEARCPGCGMPKHESYNPDSEGYYELHEAMCQACAVVSRDGENHKESRPERKVWVTDERPEGVELRPWKPS